MTTQQRPDPDRLLERIQAEEAEARLGKLKIFFGASAGVGKTYAMLSAARALRAQGVDVVVGIAETHGRRETMALMEGLEVLPRKQIAYRGAHLLEFDLDAAFARDPTVILVDELAHTNAPGSRHPKRWQDVEELLAAGIDVHTTVNVQHLESLNDVVGGISGIRVWETVPDHVFDEADEIVLVDLPPEDLLQRLKEGKVYLPDQAERAIQNFFRKGNLIALRELALRRTADRVDDQMRSYRLQHVGGQVWPTRDALLACIGPEGGAEKTVRTASRLAAKFEAPWHALYVETPRLARLPEAQRNAVLRTLKLAQELGAETAAVAAPDALRAAIDYARTHNLGKIVIGRSPGPSGWRALASRHFAERLAAVAPDLDVVVVSRAERERRVAEEAAALEEGPMLQAGYAWAVAGSAAVSLLAAALLPYFDRANIVMLFLLAVVLVAVRFGRGPAVLAAIVNVLAFDFFFVPPHMSFRVSDAQYLVTFAVMLSVGLITGHLMASLRYQARVAGHREERAHHLYEMARSLSAALTEEQVAEIADRSLEAAFRAKATVLLLGPDDTIVQPANEPQDANVDLAVARWCLDRGAPAGVGTDTLPSIAQLYLPLKAPMRIRGVLVVEPRSRRRLLVPEQRRLLDTFAALIGIALERVHFVSVAQETLVSMESERLRNSLLAALSHDLRTPLTALVGLAETLSLQSAGAESDQRDQVDAIREQARRTAQLVNNLLEMARLQSGEVRLKRDWQSLEELVGAAIKTLGGALDRHNVRFDLPVDLPLLRCDAVLIERVLANLLENAAKYTPPGTEVCVTAAVEGGQMSVEVLDRGPGLPPGQEQAVFDKFTRGQKETAVPGVGLGLAICRAIVEAHKGRMWAENRLGGGVRFAFVLPLEPVPQPQPQAQAAAS